MMKIADKQRKIRIIDIKGMENMKTVGLVMIVKNESRCLEKCLSGVKNIVDEIYITDTGSNDNTVEIAERFNAHISTYEWNNDFAAARNYALAQSDCDWNLVLDADEYLISGTREDIQNFIEQKGGIGVICIKNLCKINEKQSGEEYTWKSTPIARLLPKGTWYKGRIHEQPETSLPLQMTPLVFEHDGYLYGVKSERNLPILLEEVRDNPEDAYFQYQTARAFQSLKRYEEACEYYDTFYKLVPLTGTGYRTGGIIDYLHALIEAKDYDAALVIAENEKGRLADYAEFHFACGLLYTSAVWTDTGKYISLLPNIERSYLKCLEIGEVPLHQGMAGCGSFKAAYNLATWYEVSGNMDKALYYYCMAADENYSPAIERLKKLQK